MSATDDQQISFGRGATLIREGDGGDFCYLILSGRVEVFRMVDDAKAMLAELGDGGVVGEMALIDPAPRSASVVAVEPTVCRRINAAALERALAASPPLARYLLQTYIRNIRFASGIAPPGQAVPMTQGDLAELVVSERTSLRILDRKSFSAGDVVFRNGQPGYSAYLVQSGRIELLRELDDGSCLPLRSVGPGEVFGELALLTGSTRLATAVVREAASCEVISTSSLKALLAASPPIVRALMRIYAGVILRQAAVPPGGN